MASVHEMNFNDVPNHSPSCTAGSSCNLNDCSLPLEEDVLDSFSSGKGPQPLFHSHHGNERPALQDLHSSSNQPPSYEVNSILPYNQQLDDILTIPESSSPICHQSSEKVSSMVHDKLSEIRFSGNDDAVPHITSGTEFRATQKSHSLGQDLYDQQADTIDGSSPPTTQPSPSSSRQLISESHNFSEKGCSAIQEMNTQTELDATKLGATGGSYPSVHQFVERDMHHFQEYDSLIPQQSWNEPSASQSSLLLSHQPHQNTLNISQTSLSVSHDVSGNRVIAHKASDFRENVHDSGEFSKVQKLPLQSLQHSLSKSEDIPSLLPQRLQQSERDQSLTRKTNSSGHQTPEKNFIQDCLLHSSKRKSPNQPIVNQDLHSLNRQPDESKTRETQGLHSLPLAENTNKRQSPDSFSQQQLKKGSSAIPHTETEPSASNTYPLPGSSLEKGSFKNKKQNICSDQKSANGNRKDYDDLIMLQLPYSNKTVLLNILVFGPADSTERFLQTFAGAIKLRFTYPYNFAFQRNITRCGILTTVSLWKIDDLTESIHFLKSCSSSKSTIIFMLNAMDGPEDKDRPELLTLKTLINLMRHDRKRNVPIILVRIKLRTGISDNELGSVNRNMTDKGFRLKAKHDLAAYLECSVDFLEEVEAVMFTAIDVSFLYS